MNLRKILTPDLRKGLLFMLILMFTAFFFEWTYQLDWGQKSYPVYETIHFMLLWPMWLGLPVAEARLFSPFINFLIVIISGISNLAYWYVLSSLTVVAYDRRRG